MTRLLQLMAGAKVGGAEKFFERFTLAMEKTSIQQHVAIRTNPDRATLFRNANVSFDEFRFGGALDFSTQRHINKLAKKFEPDICLSWMSRASNYMPSHAAYVKAARLGGYYDLKYYKNCDYLVGNTEDICRYLREKGWPSDKVHYLPNFVDPTPLPALKRALFDTPDDAPLLLGLGRLHENKAFDLGLHVLAQIPNAYYWIAGEGPEREALIELANKLGVTERVRFLGWRNDVAALFATANIFLCTSRHEPLGNMVIESWAHSTPIVAAASQGPTQLIIDGETGLLSPIDDADQMAKNVQKLLASTDISTDIAQAGNAAYKNQFTEEQVIGRYQAFFDKIIKSRS